ncbi:MAG: tRNA (adenosine(37)-N6)-threonylcarbamoyltransferase complex dimerization subunit type 1 TsaB [Thermodesulfobacteriota bacterium]|nr:tRNA (adenosine(37)-N6)-threonylcarbamoyltransferase complex dimerization subunit type 1 TsaB [Thermodesulfobacteriota bacterium]
MNSVILAVNTSTIQPSAALMEENGTLVAEYFINPGSKNLRVLMPAVHSMLTLSGSDLHDIKALIVAIGPGSFTGLRTGLSAAKGMAHGLRIPIIGMSSLEAIAHQLPHTTYPICPIIESRKGNVFTSLFGWSDDNKMIRIKEDSCLEIKDLGSIIDRATIFLGNHFESQGPIILKTLGHKALLAPPHLWNLKASAVGTSGLKRFLKHDFDNLQDLVPSYLRPPDIRPNPFIPT